MTKDEIIALAKDAGATVYTNRHYSGEPAMAFSNGKLVDFANAIQAKERDRCAQICLGIANAPSNCILGVAVSCAEAIRSLE